jgi:hypothetical protein
MSLRLGSMVLVGLKHTGEDGEHRSDSHQADANRGRREHQHAPRRGQDSEHHQERHDHALPNGDRRGMAATQFLSAGPLSQAVQRAEVRDGLLRVAKQDVPHGLRLAHEEPSLSGVAFGAALVALQDDHGCGV